nr:metallophosphoesterase [Pedobacter sp. ASV2]
MKILAIVILFFLVPMHLFAQVDQDGPYIVRKGNQIISTKVINDQLKVDTLKENDLISVEFYAHKDWNFSFKLHKKIETPAATYKAADKLLVLSDIEGEFEAFRALMIGNKVIDEKYNWIFGKGHLVICGDLFDRGKDVMPYIWLLYKLEEDAAKKGGNVHVLLGNHDVMNMAGDLRYLSPKYPASAKLMGVDYLSLLAQDTEIGTWLRSKNAIEKIGDRLFLHGGISPKINALDLSIEAINEKCRSYYGIPTKQLKPDGSLFMSSGGPFWYRGYFGKDSTSVATVDSTLTKFNVKQIVVGHTITADNIASYYGGKVIGVDVDEHRGHRRALLCLGNKQVVVDDKGKQYSLKQAARAGEIQ